MVTFIHWDHAQLCCMYSRGDDLSLNSLLRCQGPGQAGQCHQQLPQCLQGCAGPLSPAPPCFSWTCSSDTHPLLLHFEGRKRLQQDECLVLTAAKGGCWIPWTKAIHLLPLNLECCSGDTPACSGQHTPQFQAHPIPVWSLSSTALHTLGRVSGSTIRSSFSFGKAFWWFPTLSRLTQRSGEHQCQEWEAAAAPITSVKRGAPPGSQWSWSALSQKR